MARLSPSRYAKGQLAFLSGRKLLPPEIPTHVVMVDESN
jgi:hypothetical protein